MILAGPGFLGLRRGAAVGGLAEIRREQRLLTIFKCSPGNKLVRRKDDVPISATLIGFQAQSVRMFAKYQELLQMGRSQHAAAR